MNDQVCIALASCAAWPQMAALQTALGFRQLMVGLGSKPPNCTTCLHAKLTTNSLLHTPRWYTSYVEHPHHGRSCKGRQPQLGPQQGRYPSMRQPILF